jgi:aspartate carbamoyltransferase regulatory subunit
VKILKMPEPAERFKLLVQMEKVKLPWLESKTGIDKKRWANVKSENSEMRAKELQALSLVWPEYSVWLISGEEIPEVGQISPLTKKINTDCK